MQTYPVVFTGAAQRVEVNVPGRYLVLLRLDTNPVNIELYWHGRKLNLGTLTNWTTGPLAGLEIGPLPTLDDSGAAFDRVVLESTGADTCVLGIGDGSVRYNRAAGTVSLAGPLLADNADAQAAGAQSGLQVTSRLQAFNGATYDRLRTVDEGGGVGSMRVSKYADEVALAGVACFGGAEQGAGGAGTNSMVQLFNPAASGRVLYVDRMIFSVAGAGSLVNVSHHNAAFTTNTNNARNKTLGGAAPLAEVRRQAPVGGVGTHIFEIRAQASQGNTIEFTPPVRIPEGFGLHAEDVTANTAFGAQYQWREKTS